MAEDDICTSLPHIPQRNRKNRDLLSPGVGISLLHNKPVDGVRDLGIFSSCLLSFKGIQERERRERREGGRGSEYRRCQNGVAET